MSTTPRTDAAWNSTFIHNDVAKAANDLFIFARQLERELAEANKKIEALSLRCLESESIASSFSQRSDELETERQRLQFSSIIESMDLRDLIITTHPETPVV